MRQLDLKLHRIAVGAVALAILGMMVVSTAMATQSQEFFLRGDEVYDAFGICRSRGAGEDGFLQLTDDGFDPIIVRESFGENIDTAWELGITFAEKYPEPNQRAEQIFYFVRNKVVYTSDVDEFGHEEFAQNADELAGAILKKGSAPGDCEDDAILLAVLYKAAGFRSAIVLLPGHAAALVHLPGYNKASRTFTLEGEQGWVWLEATGRTNPMGWLAPSLVSKPMAAREITEEAISKKDLTYKVTSVKQKSASTGGGFSLGVISPFFGVVFVLWLLSSMRRRPAKRRR